MPRLPILLYTWSIMPRSILIVEDSPLLRTVVRDALESDGFVVSEAENGKLGIEKALAEHPDLIMLDLIMPVMDGMSMFKDLRADAWGAHVPVIMFSDTDGDKVTTWMNGEKLDFFKKDNWMIEEVITKVKDRLGIA